MLRHSYLFTGTKNILRLEARRYFIQRLWESLKDSTKVDPQQERDNFQSWAEFEHRGFIRPEYVRAWVIEEYGSPEEKLKIETLNAPSNRLRSAVDARRTYLQQSVRHPNDVLVKVHAASLNPIDILISNGYGANLFNFQRNMLFDRIQSAFSYFSSVRSQFGNHEFPLILGRDFSGTVVDVGSSVHDIQVGDEVYGAPNLFRSGTLTDHIAVDLSEVVQRPAILSHIEAASIPYVSLTTAAALRDLVVKPLTPKHALVFGGSGGIGTFAIQYLQAYGFTVTTTCSSEGVPLCNSLGANCIDYTTQNVDDIVEKNSFSIVFDPIGAASPEWSTKCLVYNGTYVSLKSPLLELTNKYGVVIGSSNTYLTYIKEKVNNLNINFKWGFFKPDRKILLEISRIIDAGLIAPVVKPENIFSFDDVPAAFKLLSGGHMKGKAVINVSGLPEAIVKPSVEKIIHL